MDNQFVLRRADITDIEALSQLYQKTFQETFMEDFSIPYSEKDLDSYFRSFASPESFAKKINNPKRAVWVIEDSTNCELVAYAIAGPCDAVDIPHPDICSNKDGAINLLYVRRHQRSHGLGQQLMNVILTWLEEQYPTGSIWLTVSSQDLKTQNFYTHYGFSKVGDFDSSIGEWKDHKFIMKRQTGIS
ncbi:unnamed protein product [Rotaria sordida]|uniref:N-acetyltransferase domain-containing protein n=1 Tax=Rotaria sordida TaxID=392033 RepID=A0A819HTL4_9BILA|nr:unnamed protein product [Rotaria sordida]CAF3903415.1 unnamed protein product [Rotaria sordida]